MRSRTAACRCWAWSYPRGCFRLWGRDGEARGSGCKLCASCVCIGGVEEEADSAVQAPEQALNADEAGVEAGASSAGVGVKLPRAAEPHMQGKKPHTPAATTGSRAVPQAG